MTITLSNGVTEFSNPFSDDAGDQKTLLSAFLWGRNAHTRIHLNKHTLTRAHIHTRARAQTYTHKLMLTECSVSRTVN